MPPKPKKKNVSAIGPSEQSSVMPVLKQSESDEQLFSNLSRQIVDAQTERSTWQLKRETYYRMRMRMRKEKSFPFAGASNLRLPTLDKYIRKAKASLINLIWSGKPKATVAAAPTGNPDAAMKLEYYLDWLIDHVIKPLRNLVIMTDKMEQHGFSFIEVLWKMEDEKRVFEISLDELPQEVIQVVFALEGRPELIEALAKIFEIDLSESVRVYNEEQIQKAADALAGGEKKVRITVADETYNNVDWLTHDAEFVHVPADSFLDPQKARFIAVETYEPFDVVMKKSREGIYSKDAFDTIDTLKNLDPEKLAQGRTSSFRTTDEVKNLREGIERLNGPSRNVKLYRMYAWYDLDGDGMEERNVFILAPEFKVVLSKFAFPYHHRKWPIVRFDSELIDDRWYATRGYPELIEDLVKEIDTQHNQKIDQQTIRNAPMFTFRSGIVNPNLVKFIPGQGIPVPGTTPLNDAIAMMNNTNSNAEFSYRDEEMLLKSDIQELFGQMDYSLQSQINRRQPRTASEVTQQAQSTSVVFSLDAMIYSDSMSEVMTQTVQLLQQYLPDSNYFPVVGEGASIHMTREEIQGGYIVGVRANDLTMNPMQRIQMCEQTTAYLSNPMFTGVGIVTPQNLFYLAKRRLQAAGEMSWQQLITMPPPPTPPGPPPAITQVKTKFEELTDAEQAQVLQSGGIEPDFQGRALKKQQEIEEGKESESEPAQSQS